MNKLTKKHDSISKDRREKHIEFPSGLLNVKIVKDASNQEFIRIDVHADEGYMLGDFTNKTSEEARRIGTGNFSAISVKLEQKGKDIRHGKKQKQWAGSVDKRFCEKHFNQYNELGWLSPEDTIEIVPESECESIDHRGEH
jgi:hypothetical protein